MFPTRLLRSPHRPAPLRAGRAGARASTPSARVIRPLLAASCALTLTVALGACTGGDEPAGVVPDGVPTALGPVTLALPQGFQVLDDVPNTDHANEVFLASTDPKGAGGSPRISVLYSHKRSGDVTTYSEASKKLLGSGYGGHADIDRDEATTVPGSEGGWRLGFTRTYKNTPYREGWLFASHGDGMVRVIVRAPESRYDAASLDAVLDSVKLP